MTACKPYLAVRRKRAPCAVCLHAYAIVQQLLVPGAGRTILFAALIHDWLRGVRRRQQRC
jgi:hypothetical protein